MVNFKVLLQRIQNISIFLLTKGAHIIAFLTTKKIFIRWNLIFNYVIFIPYKFKNIYYINSGFSLFPS